MAKVRRTIRKVTRTSAYFDEQLWPVNLALFVLGGFLMGAGVAYQDFNDPRWYANAWLSVIGVPLLIVGSMIALRYVSNQVVRRGMQFSLVLSLLAHLLLIVASVELNIFNRMVADVVQPRELVERRVPDFSPFRPQEQQDHERPIETPVPEMDSDPVEREEAEETQAVPQPTPVPEPQPNPNPTVTERQTADTPTPRMSEAPAQLSRSQASVTPNISRAAPNPNTAQSASRATPSLQAANADAQRQNASREPTPQMSQTDPSQTAPSAAAVARRETPTEQPQDVAAPTLPRRVNTPTRTPVAQTTSQAQPNQAQQTTPDPLQAATTAMTRRQTTSPQTQRSEVEPTPVQPDQATPTPQRRQQPAPTQTQVAATPQPTPSRQQRVTTRPETQTVAETTAPTPSPNSASAQLNATAATAVARANTSVDAARAAVADPTTPTPRPTPSQMARRQTEANPTPSPDATPTQVTRRTAPATPTDSPNAVAPTSVAQTTSSNTPLTASSTAATRTPTSRPQVARATGNPSPATAQNPTANPSASRAERSESNDSPTVAQTPGSVGRRNQPTRATQAFASLESANPLASAPNTSDANALRPAESSVSRQPTNSPGAADNNRPSRPTPTASASNQVAQASSERTAVADAPSLQPAVTPTTPARSQVSGELASPTNIENPAVAKNSQSDGESPSMQAAPTALSRGTAGVAGIGRSANLDRNEPAGESPSLVASASARRRESTRADDSMSELNDSQPALIARNRAGEQRPSSMLQAQNVETATAAGADQPSELSATASASLTRAASDSQLASVNATKGESEVDIGPTRLVANSGADRAAGGGQPELNFETQAQIVTRSSRGGETTMTLAANEVAPSATAPEADGGGEPEVQAPDSTAVAQRRDAGDEAPSSGGPSQASQEGPSAEPNAAERMAALELARANGGEVDPGGAAGGAEGEQDEEDEEERARRLAAARQRANGGPEVDIAGAEINDTPASQPAGGSTPAGLPTPEAASADVARQAAATGGVDRPQGAESEVGEPTTTPQGGAQLVGDVRVRRAESVDTATGAPAPGGGSDSPRRAATGPTFAADVQAEELAMAGQPASGGSPDSSPLAAQGATVGRVASGRSSAAATGPIGALADVTPSDGAASQPGAVSAQRSAAVADAGPGTNQGEVAGGPQRRLLRMGAPEVADVASPSEMLSTVPPGSGEEMAAMSLAAVSTQVGRTARAATDSDLAVEVDAMEGPSGLVGLKPGAPGISARRANEQSIDVSTNTTKFLTRASGGLPDINTAAIAATTPFQKRADRGRGQMGGNPGEFGPQTNRSIEAGLVFLAKYQLPDGSWSFKGINNEPVTYSSDAAATGLCLLAFQGAGYNHREHKYAEVVRGGLDYLVKNQAEDGSLYVPSDERSNEFAKLYSHGIATIAVCEAYGMTQDPALREAAQEAINYIVNTQDPNYGGWRYTPGKFSDTSVTGWMMMALKSGELAGLDVDTDAYTRIQLWLDRAQVSPNERHLYRYNPLAPNTPARRLGRDASKSMTAVGLLARLYMGWRRDNVNMIAGADYLSLEENLPAIGFAEELNPLKKKRDTYYWYYGTQVMFHMGGDHWKKWKDALRPALIDSQIKTGDLAGSWDPYSPVPDRWGVAVGRLYVTTLNLLSLEVNFRHLPLYYDTGR